MRANLNVCIGSHINKSICKPVPRCLCPLSALRSLGLTSFGLHNCLQAISMHSLCPQVTINHWWVTNSWKVCLLFNWKRILFVLRGLHASTVVFPLFWWSSKLKSGVCSWAHYILLIFSQASTAKAWLISSSHKTLKAHLSVRLSAVKCFVI